MMMNQHALRRRVIWVVVFVLALAAVGYFAGQVGQSDSPPPAGFLAADKSYGVTIDLTQYDDKPLPGVLTALRRNGLLWLRQPILWNTLEPAPGQFKWDSLDRIFAAIEQSNQASAVPFKVIAVLGTSPQWARFPHAPAASPPVEVSDFGNFARAFAGRYGQLVNHYQIWHEPNLSANWGHTYVNAEAYVHLLRDAALNIREADSDALILSAALAPTLENGPLNLNDIEYLNQLYWFKAAPWFDIVAGQPYGFDVDPADPARPDALNFRRLELLRQVMLNYGDAGTPIWATAFGWNALPAAWNGRPSPWRSDPNKYDPPALQAQRTAAGIEQARRNWPWLGPMLAVRWDGAGLAEDDPTRGFAVSETPLQEIFSQIATAPPIATIGHYPANHPAGAYSPGWRTALTTADIPRAEPRTLTISFEGSRLDLTINRGLYRGYLWVTIDGQPANALPTDTQGRSYIVLYDPLRATETVTLAQNLGDDPHQAVIEAEGGWGQWAISGWVVSNNAHNRTAQAGLVLAGVVAGLGGLGLVWEFFPHLKTMAHQLWPRLKWRKFLALLPPLPGETGQVAVTFILAIAFYLAPAGLALALLLPLITIILYRPDLGLALIAFSLSFFQAPKQLPTGPFLLTETTFIVTAAGFTLRSLTFLFNGPASPISNFYSLLSNPQSTIHNPKSLDWAALALLALGLASTLAAPNFGVSMFEWRMLVFGSVAYYFLVRLGRDYGPSPRNRGGQGGVRWAWRLIDALVAGAALHSAIVLYRYAWAGQFVVAEGVRRALSPVYASPNNLSLFLDRVWPILLAVTVWPGRSMAPNSAAKQMLEDSKELRGTQGNSDLPSGPSNSYKFPFVLRRWLYGLGLVMVSAALYLTFSKGALLVGLPAGVIAMTLFHLLRNQGRHWGRMMALTAGSLVVIILALIPVSQTARFRTMFDFNEGSTGFFRLKLWQASLNMLYDYWPLGVGLNNFLYQYRTRYILPEAWQEPELSHPHNLILDYATRLGLGGVAILIWLQGAFWVNAWRLYQRLPEPFVLGLMGSMVVFLSHGLIDNSYFLVDLAFIFFLSLGITQRLAEITHVAENPF
jgi:hypothetical protein